MRKVLLVFALFLLLEGFSIFKKTPSITINNQTFKLSVADTQKKKEIGLSETKSLPQDQGMIFTFEKPGYYSFWMKNMTIPIDIIYINKDKIVTIHKNLQPPMNQNESPIIYNPTEPSDKVLEIPSGLSEKYNFKKGDSVKYENLGN